MKRPSFIRFAQEIFGDLPKPNGTNGGSAMAWAVTPPEQLQGL